MPKAPKARKKILLAAPVSTRWPTIDDEGRSRLLERFRSMTAPLDPTKLSYLVLGLNGAARALEQDQLELHEWVPSVRTLLALGLRRTAPATKSVDDFLKAVRLNAGTYPDKASGNDSTVASKNENETVDKPCAEVTSAVPVGRVSEPSVRVEGKTSEIEEASAPFSEEAAFTKTKDTSEVQLGIVSSETCATEGRGASSVAVDIELPEEGGLGFPDYDFDSVVEVVESSLVCPAKDESSCSAPYSPSIMFGEGQYQASFAKRKDEG
ncbi:hypothetical protein MTO96_049089 [Rhipicephalus appendiculatus]